MKITNRLIHETSPYLLQHAHNPVDWWAWNPLAFKEAKQKSRLILISIGYSSCHWCHVMAHECFEDEEIAKLMNDNFMNIKVDREERPDVDQIYMNALQLMTGHGGWPLNIVALPDGRPIWGGTYVPKNQWAGIIRQLSDLFERAPNDLFDYAAKLTEGIRGMESLVSNEMPKSLEPDFFQKSILEFKNQFDTVWGGSKGAPKFMMPNKYHFLLRYGSQMKDDEVLNHVILTLNKMADGGIFDQLGGGFSRYSVDEKWHVPHFEKMLYDNAQLVSLYCDAFLLTQNPHYEKIVKSTLEFIKKELTNEKNGFYCALDADSENPHGDMEEGAYYVWKKEELQIVLKDYYPLFADYYQVNVNGYWDNGNYILTKTGIPEIIAEKHGISTGDLKRKIEICRKKLLHVRQKRKSPGLDDKSLTSWNAMMMKAFLDAYRVFDNNEYLEMALKNASFIRENLFQKNDKLYHTFKNGKSHVNGFLDDYAFLIEAYIAFYENTFDRKWIDLAKDLTEIVLEDFYDKEKSIFYFNSNEDGSLISRPAEFQDNVIPSSNSVMAKNLFKLAHFFDHRIYRTISEKLIKSMYSQLEKYPQAYFNWLDVLMNFTFKFYEIAILGENARNELLDINKEYFPNKIVAGSADKSNLPLLKNRWKFNETWLYVCQDQSCQAPVTSAKDALKYLV